MDVTDILAGGALAWAVAEFRLGRVQARTAFEDGLVREYRDLIKPDLARLIVEAPSEDETDELFPAVWRYIDLSNEQIFLRSQGRISKSTWLVWADGIRTTLEREGFKENWTRIKEATPDDFTELQVFCANGRDPRKWTPLWRRLLRLRALSAEEAQRRAESRKRSPPND